MPIAPGAFSGRILPPLVLGLTALLAACSGEQRVSTETELPAESAPPVAANASSRVMSSAVAAAAPVSTAAVTTPILFVTQVPTAGGDRFASRLSSFANHMTDLGSVPRGGDLMIRYPNGALRNLTKEAGFGMEGLQGANAIAVREPTVHWDGKKAVFSMLVGAPSKQYESVAGTRWQIYEVSNLAQGQTAVITKVAGQPTNYNNISPLYTTDDRILFTSDRPRGGESHLYPQLDEYESTPTVTGIYSLTPGANDLKLLNHAPSGAFSPSIDSYGRVIFTRWDHLQRDQQADAGTYGAYNFASEAAGAGNVGLQAETFPESRQGMSSAFGQVNPFTYNLFTPWQMNQDGTEELTLNHIGRHELSFGYLTKSFSGDSALSDYTNTAIIANKKNIRIDGGVFQIREDPRTPGTYYGIYAREFGSLTSDQIVRFTGGANLTAEQMVFEDASPAAVNNNLSGGRFRNPLPLSTGQMLSTYTPSAAVQAGVQFRLYQLKTDAAGMLIAGSPLTSGITKSISWWNPDAKETFNGTLWELEAVEVVARTRPSNNTFKLEAPESAILAEEQVDVTALRNWMKANNLSLIVTRNQTSRDQGDVQQPFNLQVPGGVKTAKGSGKVYDISHYQILQGNQVRSYSNFKAGRRVIAQPTTNSYNPANSGGPAGSVKIATDGSSAAFVPANRALTWQTTDAAGNPVVRERVWVTTQAGEIRTCAGCHGENSKNQAGGAEAVNKPEALRALLRHWKQTTGGGPIRANSSQPLVPTRGSSASSQAVAASGAQPTSTLTAAVIQASESTPQRGNGQGRTATRSLIR